LALGFLSAAKVAVASISTQVTIVKRRFCIGFPPSRVEILAQKFRLAKDKVRWR
jgi:hypothetical protein